MKGKKKILRELGFHHSYGLWISDSDKNLKCEIIRSKEKVYFRLTKHNRIINLNFPKTEKKDVIKIKLLEKLLEMI